MSALRPAFFILNLESFISRPNVIPAFPSTPLHKQGQELRSERTVIPIHEQRPSTYFCVLTIRKQLPRNGFERSGRGQEPSRGHKFSILENVVLHRDFTSSMRLHFRSDLVGACLPQTLLERIDRSNNLANDSVINQSLL